MTLDDLLEQAAADLKIDNTDIGGESAKTSTLFTKYIRALAQERLRLAKLDAEYSKKRLARREYYLGRGTAEEYKERPMDLKILRGDADIYVDADDDLIAVKTKLVIQKEKVSALEEIVKHINNRGFQLGKMMDWLKFQNGIN